jgi:hypothetical protein
MGSMFTGRRPQPPPFKNNVKGGVLADGNDGLGEVFNANYLSSINV